MESLLFVLVSKDFLFLANTARTNTSMQRFYWPSLRKWYDLFGLRSDGSLRLRFIAMDEDHVRWEVSHWWGSLSQISGIQCWTIQKLHQEKVKNRLRKIIRCPWSHSRLSTCSLRSCGCSQKVRPWVGARKNPASWRSCRRIFKMVPSLGRFYFNDWNSSGIGRDSQLQINKINNKI